ncbi:hypothetical protein D9611_005559 [Ephemerocybe angulata]|uniref:Ribonuclease H n=1 Tax=Ephemerocybe angulata TaxID=980116 RepID=A0A8H5BIB0_9AGAR|nr:hypothetical protein D9611_005559 [Tulosesus angulatus]
MPSKPSGAFYAVRKGFRPGVYSSWGDCEDQTKGYNNAKYKKFPTRAQAEAFVRGDDEPAGAAESTAGRSVGQQASGSVIVSPDADIEGDVVYSDGACKGNGQRGSVAGIGVWWGPNDARCVMSLPHPGRYMTVTTRNIAERCPGDQTNNRAELIYLTDTKAILRVLEETPVSKTPLLIKTDSQYSIKCAVGFEQWIKNWKRNGWKNSKGEPVKNDGIIRLIEAHLDRRGKFGQKVRFAYVKGHSGDVGNDGADYQANLGAMMPFVAERDWKEDLEELLMDTLLEEAERETAPAPPPEARKRSRSPVQVARSSNAAGPSFSQPQTSRTPAKSSAARFAAIQEALSSPSLDLGEPPKKKRVITPPPSVNRSAALPIHAGPSGQRRRMSTSSPTATTEKTKYPVRVLYAIPPLVPVKKEDINLDDYADCLLSDEDLMDEIS